MAYSRSRGAKCWTISLSLFFSPILLDIQGTVHSCRHDREKRERKERERETCLCSSWLKSWAEQVGEGEQLVSQHFYSRRPTFHSPPPLVLTTTFHYVSTTLTLAPLYAHYFYSLPCDTVSFFLSKLPSTAVAFWSLLFSLFFFLLHLLRTSSSFCHNRWHWTALVRRILIITKRCFFSFFLECVHFFDDSFYSTGSDKPWTNMLSFFYAA
jgi:hypothetical protein